MRSEDYKTLNTCRSIKDHFVSFWKFNIAFHTSSSVWSSQFFEAMYTAVTYIYRSSRASLKEREEKRQWRRTYDPTYTSRRSTLAEMPRRWKRESMGRVMSMFGPRLVAMWIWIECEIGHWLAMAGKALRCRLQRRRIFRSSQRILNLEARLGCDEKVLLRFRCFRRWTKWH